MGESRNKTARLTCVRSNASFSLSVPLLQEWKDELLTWDPNDFGGLKIMRMPCERIWLPDIVLYNK